MGKENIAGICLCPQCGAKLEWEYYPRVRLSDSDVFPIFDHREGLCCVRKLTHDEKGNTVPYFTCPECGYVGSFRIPAE